MRNFSIIFLFLRKYVYFSRAKAMLSGSSLDFFFEKLNFDARLKDCDFL